MGKQCPRHHEKERHAGSCQQIVDIPDLPVRAKMIESGSTCVERDHHEAGNDADDVESDITLVESVA